MRIFWSSHSHTDEIISMARRSYLLGRRRFIMRSFILNAVTAINLAFIYAVVFDVPARANYAVVLDEAHAALGF